MFYTNSYFPVRPEPDKFGNFLFNVVEIYRGDEKDWMPTYKLEVKADNVSFIRQQDESWGVALKQEFVDSILERKKPDYIMFHLLVS